MVDENTGVSTEEKEDDAPVANPVAVDISKDSDAQVKTAQQDGTIRARVVAHFAKIEQDRRVDLLVKVMKKREELWKEYKKIKPDTNLFTESGEAVGSHWSKEQLKKRDSARKALSKIDKAFNAAINKADYEGLKKHE